MTSRLLTRGSQLIGFFLIGALQASCSGGSHDYFMNGQADQEAGHLQAAVDDYSKAIKLESADAWAYKYRAGAYEELGEHNKAIDDFTEALKLDPKDDFYCGDSVYFYRAEIWHKPRKL